MALVDGNVSYTIVTAPAHQATTPNYNGRDPADVSVINADNDTAGIHRHSGFRLEPPRKPAATATFSVVVNQPAGGQQREHWACRRATRAKARSLRPA